MPSSSRNGHQARQLVRDLKVERRKLQQEIDRAIKLSDKAIGLAEAPVTRATPRAAGAGLAVGIPGAEQGYGTTVRQTGGYRGEPSTGARWAPIQPSPEPPQEESAIQSVVRRPGVYGLAGTPITSGFIVDLGEYNASLMGRVAIPIWEEMRRSDGYVRALLAASKFPVIGAKWDIVPCIDKADPGYARAKEVADACKENLIGGLEYETGAGGWESQKWTDVVRNLLLALDFGCAVHEDVWVLDGKRLRLRNCPSRLPLTYYRWHTDPDGETLTALEQYGYRRHEFKNVTVPAEKLCRYTYHQEGANFWGISLLRGMYASWYIKKGLIRIDSIACERNGMGVPVYKLPQGFSKEDKDSAFEFVTSLAAHESTGVVEPPGDAASGFRLVGTTGSVRQIIPSIARCNSEMAMAALAMFMLSGSTPYGHRATAQTHHDFFMLAMQNLADETAWAVTTQTIRRWAQYNYGLAAPVPRAIAANVESRNLDDIVDGLTKLAGAGLVVSEDNIREVIREDWGLPEESDEGIVSPKGMTITPAGEEAGAQPISGEGQAGRIVGEPESPEEEKQPTLPVEKPKQKFVALRDRMPHELLAHLMPGFRFTVSKDMASTFTRPAGAHFVLQGDGRSGDYVVRARDKESIEVEELC